MPNLPAERLRNLAFAIVRAMGSDEGEAAVVADHLAGSNLAGHDSHGVGMIPDYARMLQAGLLVPNQELRIVADVGAVLVLEAGRGFGQRMARGAMALDAMSRSTAAPPFPSGRAAQNGFVPSRASPQPKGAWCGSWSETLTKWTEARPSAAHCSP